MTHLSTSALALVASGHLQPLCLQVTRCEHFYAIMACRGGRSERTEEFGGEKGT